jgi:HAD superfamily hydrolase (TIGR01493 family)
VGFDAVLFDWMLTLAHYPTPAEHVAAALTTLKRTIPDTGIEALAHALDNAANELDVVQAMAIADTSPAAHFAAEHLLYERAGIDAELSAAMYQLLGTPTFHPAYPDTCAVLASLAGAGIQIGIVSDIHVDLRVHAREFGFADHIDAWALSYELGVQKPDPVIFQSAIDQLGCTPARTLMVGDRAAVDGGAAALGVACLILPAPPRWMSRGLDRVTRLVGIQPDGRPPRSTVRR